MKSLKFKNHLVPLVLSGKKDVTWQMFDDKNLKAREELELINSDAGEKFGEAVIESVREKKLGEINDEDFAGHEKFESRKEMFETYKTYYGEKVNWDTSVKIIKLKLK